MQFLNKPRPRPTISILPMIDILAILLIYFIVNFRKPQEVIQVNLPSNSGIATDAEAKEITLINISREGDLFWGKEKVTTLELAKRLESSQAQAIPERIGLNADEEAPIKVLLKVWGALDLAGIQVEETVIRTMPSE